MGIAAGVVVATIIVLIVMLAALQVAPAFNWPAQPLSNAESTSHATPRTIISGSAPTSGCAKLFVWFNSSGQSDVWVAPPHSFIESNGTIHWTSYYWTSGPTTSGRVALQVPPPGWDVVMFNPSSNSTIYMGFSFVAQAC